MTSSVHTSLAAVLSRAAVVLVEPQDPLNIGGVLRACHNMGVHDIRLVNPANPDPKRIRITAPRLEDEARALPVFTSLDEALADGSQIIGFTARRREARREVMTLPQLEAQLQNSDLAADERLLMLFGREDSGLNNRDLDRCHHLVCVDTEPSYSSLNLAQAVLLAVYTVRRAWSKSDPTEALSRPYPLATHQEIAPLLRNVSQTLRFIEFFKFDGAEQAVMRAFSSIVARAGLDVREVRVLHGIFSEVRGFCTRTIAAALGDKNGSS